MPGSESFTAGSEKPRLETEIQKADAGRTREPDDPLPAPDESLPEYDVIVIGAGPAGCEASLAAGRAGAHVLCLTINLDNIGLHPAGPLLAGGEKDPRYRLLRELRELNGVLPVLLDKEGIANTAEAAAGRVVIDRRRLSLAYKETVETAARIELRQALVTGLQPVSGAWHVETRLGECFTAGCLVIATGTQLEGKVHEGGTVAPGGRHGEIPSNSLAACLQSLGLALERANATCFPRLDSRAAPLGPSLLPDGSQLGELYALDLEFPGDRAAQLASIRTLPELDSAWMTRPLFTVRHWILSHGQVSTHLQCLRHPGLFVAGRAAGACNYSEAAALGLIAGSNAAIQSAGKAPNCLTTNKKVVTKLCEIVASQEIRPVTIRREPPGC